MESRPGPGSLAPGGRAGGHYLLRGTPLRRRRARPGPGPRGAGSGSRAAGKDHRAPQTNRGSRWPGRSLWSVAWSVPRRGPGREPPRLPVPHGHRGRRRPRFTDPDAAILLRGPKRPPGRRRKVPGSGCPQRARLETLDLARSRRVASPWAGTGNRKRWNGVCRLSCLRPSRDSPAPPVLPQRQQCHLEPKAPAASELSTARLTKKKKKTTKKNPFRAQL